MHSMYLNTLLLSLLLSIVLGFPVLEARDPPPPLPSAAYVLGNDANGAYIVSLPLKNGAVSSPLVTTPTGGKGLLGNTATGQSGPDGLSGQNAVIVDGKYLFTVNAGSNTASMFLIDCDNPTHLTLVGKPADTLGEFPSSIAYSPILKQACVVNGGAVNGVACFAVSDSHGLVPLDKQLRSISPAVNQTTPPVGPPGTVSNIFFNPDSTALIVIVKGNPGTTPPTPSTNFVWPVVNGYVATTPVLSLIADMLVAFGGPFIDDEHILDVDASFGVGLLKLRKHSFELVEKVHTPIANQSAVCWIAYAPQFSRAYVPDAGQPVMTVINSETAAIELQVEYDAALGGGLDLVIGDDGLYLLTGTGSVAVFAIHEKAPQLVQNTNLSSVSGGKTNIFQGMAVFPS